MSKKIYICSPGDNMEEIKRTRQYMQRIGRSGFVPVSAAVMLDGVYDETDITNKVLKLRCTMSMVEMCDEVWVFGDRTTDEMLRIMKHADGCKIPSRIRPIVSDTNQDLESYRFGVLNRRKP